MDTLKRKTSSLKSAEIGTKAGKFSCKGDEEKPENKFGLSENDNRFSTQDYLFLEESDEDMLSKETILLTNNDAFYPELVWQQVLKKIRNPDDIERCSNCSLFFWKILKTTKQTKVVLPNVFRALSNVFLNSVSDFYKEINLSSIPWRVQENRGGSHFMSGIWKSRLVCKSWNKAIEDLHQDKLAGHFAMEEDMSASPLFLLGKIWGSDDFESLNDIYAFTAQFRDTHYNMQTGKTLKCPFFGRCLNIDISASVETIRDDFFGGLMNMLKTFGGEIWHIRINVLKFSRRRIKANINQLKKMVLLFNLMPNLKSVQIEYYSQNLERYQREILEIAMSRQIQQTPLPSQPNLEFVSTSMVPVPFLTDIIGKNQAHINRIEFCKSTCCGSYVPFLNQLPHLNELSLEICTLNDFEAFENCRVKLKLCKFHFIYDEFLEFISWSRIFVAIENKLDKDRCVELVLKLPEPNSDENKVMILHETLNHRLKLNRVEKLSIGQSTKISSFCLDFLLPFKDTLTTVVVYTNQSCTIDISDTVVNQEVHFLSFENRVLESNIFLLCPRLQVFDVFGSEHVQYRKHKNRKEIIVIK